ncbi:MAG: hypothetical protein FJW69_01500 [Actinobacteria bacterium]|nr:hypothetical protein [Actinomycetota bacterium]
MIKKISRKILPGLKKLTLKVSGFFTSSKDAFDYISFMSTPHNAIADRKISAFTKKRLFFSLSLLITFLIIYGMLFFCFSPDIIFKNTTTNGGDMGAHNYPAKFFIDEILPNFRMTGWDMGWFAGMPMLTFYFPLHYFLIALLSKVFAYNIAFKLVTILGSLILPAALYHFGKSFKFEYPYPEFASIGAMAFLYMKSFTIYGGNFLGTYAGEFSYSISFGLVFIFLAALYRGMQREKYDWLFALNCIILACIVLTHLITLIALFIIVPGVFFLKRDLKSAKYIIAVFAVGFFLSAFWSLPFVLLIKWTPTMNWTNIKDLKELFPLELIPALVLGVAGLFFSTIKKDRRMVPVIWTIIVLMSLFFTWEEGRLYNARFLPFIFIFIYLLAAYGLMNLYWVFTTGLSSINFTGAKQRFYKFAVIAFVPVVAFIAGAAIMAGNPLGPAWARHNYTGFESKADWKLYDDLMKYLDSIPYGRVMFEFDKSIIQKFGTPRSFELIPYWTKQPTMEGLLVESSLTAPFHYINQAELSVKPRGTVAGWKVPSRDYEAAMKHLIYFNISYIMASSPEVIADLKSDTRVEFLNKIEPYYFYEIKGLHNYVEVMKNKPYRYSPEDWIWDMRDWYLNADNVDNPVIYDDGSEGIKQFEEITKEQLSDVPDNPFNAGGIVLSEIVEREKIEFKTTAIGVPHLIKVSYFPNWKAAGAEGPYLVSPSLMMVIPTQSDVTLYYGITYANRIGVTLTMAGWAIIAVTLILNLAFHLKSKPGLKKPDE